MRFGPLFLAVVFFGTGVLADAHGGAHSSGHHSSQKAEGVQRDRHGRIARSHASIYRFRKGNPCPSTGSTTGACPGYVIDHIQPLKRGGADEPWNMQWQTKEEARIKDRTE